MSIEVNFLEDTKMKKYILAAVTLAAFSGLSFAQQNPAPAAAPAAAPAKMEKPAAKHAPKAKVEIFNGDISAIDTAANAVTVKDAKGVEKKFSLEAAQVAGLSQGEKVKITVKEGKTTVKVIKTHEGKHQGKKAPAKTPAAK